jgi:hypothetical protein
VASVAFTKHTATKLPATEKNALLTNKESKAPFKTLMEFCPSDENLELAIRAIARNKKRITADDLHVLDVSVAKLGRKKQVYGAELAKLCKDGFLKKVGYIPSSRDVCHNRPVMLWEHVEGT